MLTRTCLSVVLLVAMPVSSQVVPSATGGAVTPDAANTDAVTTENDAEMRTPPSVSGEAYPTETGSEARSNYLRGDLTLDTAYNDNVQEGNSTSPISDITYSIKTTIALDQTTSRLHQTYTYSPGFTIYQRESTLNAADQSGTMNLQYHMSPHAIVTVTDAFQKSSNAFNQPYSGVSGSTQPPTASVVAPFADQMSNTVSAALSYQYSRNGMIGGSGTSTMLNYSNPAEVTGLSNSNSRGGSAFYNLRISSVHYIGANYQYSQMIASGLNSQSETQTHSLFIFYTAYLNNSLSLSISGGLQHYAETQTTLPESGSWAPAVTASMGWQRKRTNFAASYSRTVTGDGGLLGAFDSNSASAFVRWQLAHTWTLGSSAGYTIQRNALPTSISSSNGGHTLSGRFSVEHSIRNRIQTTFGYERLQQSYGGVEVISTAPESNRVSITISYQFTRPLGR